MMYWKFQLIFWDLNQQWPCTPPTHTPHPTPHTHHTHTDDCLFLFHLHWHGNNCWKWMNLLGTPWAALSLPQFGSRNFTAHRYTTITPNTTIWFGFMFVINGLNGCWILITWILLTCYKEPVWDTLSNIWTFLLFATGVLCTIVIKSKQKMEKKLS